MIHAFFLFNHISGDPHVIAFYDADILKSDSEDRHDIVRDSLLSCRESAHKRRNRNGRGVVHCGPAWGSWKHRKHLVLVYQQTASVILAVCVDENENVLEMSHIISDYVEALDIYFQNVTEMDIVQNTDLARMVWDQMVIGGISTMTTPKEAVNAMEGMELDYNIAQRIADGSAAKVLDTLDKVNEEVDESEIELRNAPLMPGLVQTT